MALIKAIPVSNLANYAMVEAEQVPPNAPPSPLILRSEGRKEEEDGKFLVVGHRGSGMNVMESPDTRMKAFKENSILAFNAAASLSHLHFLEFDVRAKDYSGSFCHTGWFTNKDSLVAWCRGVARSLNMVLIILKSYQSSSTRYGKVLLGCEKYGGYKSRKKDTISEPERRNTRTKKSGCTFSMKGREYERGKWVVDMISGVHNHDLPHTLQGHAFAGRLTGDEYDYLKVISASGVKPKAILEGIRQAHPENVTSRQQIYNARWKMKKEDRRDRTVTEQALHMLAERDYFYCCRACPITNEVSDLILAHPQSLHLLKMFPYVIIMDTTYKTNRYNMPLCEIVGLTSTEKTFAIAFAFMGQETVDHYEWVLDQLRYLCGDKQPEVIVTDRELGLLKGLKSIFPEVKHILCMVHVMRNIEENAYRKSNQKTIEKEFISHCTALFKSKSEETYEARLLKMRERWGTQWGLMTYLQETWLWDYKEAIVEAWTDKYYHFGNKTTNRVESAHALLKNTLATAIGGFDTVIFHMHIMLEDQIHQIRGSLEKSRELIPTVIEKDPMFVHLRYKVSFESLKYMLELYTRAKTLNVEESCDDGWWRTSYGLPCAHEFARAIQDRVPMALHSVHLFWRQVMWDRLIEDDPTNDVSPRLSLVDICMAEFWKKYEVGDINNDRMWRLWKAYHDTNNPTWIPMIEPPMRVTKGRPKKNSTTRDPSSFEYVRKEKESRAKKRSSGSRGRGARGFRGRGRTTFPSVFTVTDDPAVEQKKPKVSADEPTIYLGFNFGVRNIDRFMFSFIRRVEDVAGDGHCGYRALAVLLGRSEHEYKDIRRELVLELCKHIEVYRAASLCTPIEELIDNVNFMESGSCTSEYWMEMPMVGLAFATLYNVALVLLSRNGPHTCLPMITDSPNTAPPSTIHAMALVGQCNHFVPIWLDEVAPIPPIAYEWQTHHHSSVNGWDDRFSRKIERFNRYRARTGR